MSERTNIPDPYDVFFRWCDANGFRDVGSGWTKDMPPKRFDEAITTYVKACRAAHHLPQAASESAGRVRTAPNDPGSICNDKV
jgi:hypothetical protein